MPTRDIKESCRTSRTLAKVSAHAERLFWRLLTYADDYGRMPADADVVRAACFPVMLDTVRESHVSDWLLELSAADLIRLYTADDGKIYAFFPTWRQHQRVRAKRSKYPAPASADICQQMPAIAGIRSDKAVNTEVLPETPKTPETPTTTTILPTWPSLELLMHLYNEIAPDECRAAEVLNSERRKKAARYLRDFPEEDFWRQAFAEIRQSRFLRGLVPASGGRGKPFVADFDWFLTKGQDGSENCVKVYEGRYRD